jgi:hypothetical protein
MSFLLGLLAARGVSALLGTLLLATRAGPGFAGPVLTVRGDSVWLETELVRGFDRPLVQILESGSMVAVSYTVIVLTHGQDGRVSARDTVGFFHSAVYEPSVHSFTTYCSEQEPRTDTAGECSPQSHQSTRGFGSGSLESSCLPGGSLRVGLTRQAALEKLVRVKVALGPLGRYRGQRAVSARIEAALNTIELEAMNRQELDLNAFWHFRYPRAATAWLRLEER